jgi:hypothetical protein
LGVGLSLVLLAASLAVSLREIQLSVHARLALPRARSAIESTAS